MVDSSNNTALEPIKVLTCNIRTSYANDKDNNWVLRKAFCMETILQQQADLIGFQEVSEEQYADLRAKLVDFEPSGLCFSQAHVPINAIFYRRDRFALRDAGGYWLSTTPHICDSKSWDTSQSRLANWVYLKDQSNDNRPLRFINTHLDHVGFAARFNQARVITENARSYPKDLPQILTGDFNCDATSIAIAILREAGWQDSYGALHGTETPGITYHEFKGNNYKGQGYAGTMNKIDWVLGLGPLTPIDAQIISHTQQGRHFSDHYFVSGTYQFNPLPSVDSTGANA